jgi:hypothetical protein
VLDIKHRCIIPNIGVFTTFFLMYIILYNITLYIVYHIISYRSFFLSSQTLCLNCKVKFDGW